MTEEARDDFKLSQEETDRLHEAFKKPDFRKLLADYAQEISDPENKKKYEEELVALEKQRGVDMKYIHPQPGFVMKAWLKPECSRKIFINMCHSDLVEAATSSPAPRTVRRGKGDHWNIPYVLTPPREDLDKSNNRCTVVDAIFNAEAFAKGSKEPRFKQVLIDTVLDALEKQLDLSVDRNKLIHLRVSYKGVPVPAVIRKQAEVQHTEENEREVDNSGANPLNIPFPPLPEETEARSHKDRQIKKNTERKLPAQPKYTVVHRGEFSMQDFTNDRWSTLVKRPKELVISVELPGVDSAASLDLEIFEKRVMLQCNSPLYELDLALAYAIDEEKGQAQFDKAKHILSITLPVLPLKMPLSLPLPFNAVSDTQEQDSVLPLKTPLSLLPPSNAVTDTREQDSILPLKTPLSLPPPSNAVTDTREQDSVLPMKTPLLMPPPSNAVSGSDIQEMEQDSVLSLKTPLSLPPPSNAVSSSDIQEMEQDSVLPLKMPLPLSPPSNAVSRTDTQETAQDSVVLSSSLSHDEKGEVPEVVPSAEASAPEDFNSSPSFVPALATAEVIEKMTKTSSVTNTVIASHITTGEVQDWSSKGHWVCPQFTYRQENDVVVFCLHVVGVKERSLVQLFDDHFAQVTFSTSKEHYSFHASFPESCGLDVDDCTVDISHKNVVLVLKKRVTEGSGCLWERLRVGLNASHTTEKFFLTVSNAQSVIDNLVDPWEQSVWSDQATVSATLTAARDQVDLVISDPADGMKSVSSLPDGAAGVCTTSEAAQSLPPPPIDLSTMVSLSKDPPCQNGTPIDKDYPVPGIIGPRSGAPDPGVDTGGERVSGVTSPSFKVEADGSIFVRGDENYMRDRDMIRPILTGKQDTTNKLKLSNRLVFTLD